MSNSLDPDQARHFVGPDLGPNCLQRLSADNTSRQRVLSEEDNKKGMPLFMCISNAVIVCLTRKCHLAMELRFIKSYIIWYIFPYDVDFNCLVFTINRIFRKIL